MNRALKINLTLLLFLQVCVTAAASAQVQYRAIKNYRVCFARAKVFEQEWITLRSFESEGKLYYLLVNPYTVQTKTDETGIYKASPMSLDQLRKVFNATPYIRALKKAGNQDLALQDAGIESGMPKETGISLTADLCPSHRPLDRRIFTDMFNEFKRVEKPVPIALSVTGIWMNRHQADLQWLKQMQQNGEIYVTWINHSYNHRVSSTLPLKQNFLLEAGTDINYEVLQTEQDMLQNGLLPSSFFRFPGLVSDKQVVDTIISYGLIPVGTDAWLAKGQQPHNGSIVLIHGNGNEPVGVADFIKLLQQEAGKVAKKQWLIYDLRESVEDEFSDN